MLDRSRVWDSSALLPVKRPGCACVRPYTAVVLLRSCGAASGVVLWRGALPRNINRSSEQSMVPDKSTSKVSKIFRTSLSCCFESMVAGGVVPSPSRVSEHEHFDTSLRRTRDRTLRAAFGRAG